MIKVGVLGAKGRMGAEVVRAIQDADGLELVAALDLGDSLQELIKHGAEVVVDFTTPDSVMANLDFLIKNNINTIFTITGGFAMHLNDSFGRNDNFNIYYQHHEQACARSRQIDNKVLQHQRRDLK